MDLRVIKTQKALLDTFMEMLSEQPFDNITVNNLCEQALVRRATFYKHFTDKYDFFAFFIRTKSEEFNKMCAQNNTEEPSILFCFQKTLDFFNEHESLINNVLKSSMFSTLLELFADEIYVSVLSFLEHEDTASISKEILASFYVGGIVETIKYWIMNQKKVSEKELLENVSILINRLQIEEK